MKMRYIFLWLFVFEVCYCNNETIVNNVDDINDHIEITTVSLSVNDVNDNYTNDVEGRIDDTTFSLEKTAVIRKCCQYSYYYNTDINECSEANEDEIFLDHTNGFLNYNNYSLSIISEKIDNCPETYHTPELMFVPYDNSIEILEDGSIYDHNSGLQFDLSRYCLEMVGATVESSSLVLVYCLGPKKIVTKCCPHGYYFDTRNWGCSPYFNEADPSHDLSLLSFMDKGYELSHKDLQCNDTFAKIRLNEAYFNEDHLCISKSHLCYNSKEYCVDNMLKEGENELIASAYVCPYNFINKCCPDGQSLYKHGCMETQNNSLSLIHILKTSRYRIKSVSGLGIQCTPVSLEDNTKSDIKWSIDINGFVIVKTGNETVSTRNFCIDDFTSDHEVFPVIKVCSEEIKIYHEVSSIKDYPDNVIGKCCSENAYYHSNSKTGQNGGCQERTDNRFTSFEDELERQLNITSLVFLGFPDCSFKEYYHKFYLFPSYYDYGKLTEGNNLEVISKENNCTKKTTKVDRSRFCVDLVPYGENYYRPVAIVCAPRFSVHSERDPLVVSFVGISCAALISAFFNLIFMRVRRGMVTVKKINTLAGRILTSYVLSQLVGYLSLGIGILADFQDGMIKCYFLVGFMMFFIIASFCWNTSICLEGLLLTMHVQMSEMQRYICHSVWAWGVPAVITAVAIIKDTRRDSLPCDAITPKIGVQRCFSLDGLAQLLYFYLPISLTVIINACLLVLAKFLRKNKLKNLEKDPNRIRRHENLQQVLSIKSIRSKLKGEPSIKPASNPNHSGLRTHHNRNIWIESLKLVLWSGTTWLLEICGTLFVMYRGRPQGEWYSYLWYFPVCFNCLRGFGIFIIISFNAENKTRVLRTAKTLRISFSTTLSKMVPSLTFKRNSEGSDPFNDKKKKTMKRNTVQFSTKSFHDSKSNGSTKQRSTSVSTIVTNISSSTLCTNVSENNGDKTLQVPSFYHSVSQIDNKTSSTSFSLPDVYESFESECEVNQDKEEDVVSLDNTSMENFFWENELQARRNEVNFSNFQSSLEEKKYDEGLSNLMKKESKDEKPNPELSNKKFYEDFEFCTHL